LAGVLAPPHRRQHLGGHAARLDLRHLRPVADPDLGLPAAAYLGLCVPSRPLRARDEHEARQRCVGELSAATLPGFMLVSGAKRATWYAQAKVRGGRQTKVRVGHWPEVPQVEARRMAAEVLAAMGRGEDPGE